VLDGVDIIMSDKEQFDMGECAICGNRRQLMISVCEHCFNDDSERGIYDFYDEPTFYSCAMCGMEIVSFEVVREHKYCHSCAAIERSG